MTREKIPHLGSLKILFVRFKTNSDALEFQIFPVLKIELLIKIEWKLIKKTLRDIQDTSSNLSEEMKGKTGLFLLPIFVNARLPNRFKYEQTKRIFLNFGIFTFECFKQK